MDTPVDSTPDKEIPPAQIGNEAIITPEVDALVDRIEAGGLLFYVMASGSASIPRFLAFELCNTTATPSPDAMLAASALTKLFNSDRAVRGLMIDQAMSAGSLYREFGADVWHDEVAT